MMTSKEIRKAILGVVCMLSGMVLGWSLTSIYDTVKYSIEAWWQ